MHPVIDATTAKDSGSLEAFARTLFTAHRNGRGDETMSRENDSGGRTRTHDGETIVHRVRYDWACERSLSTEVVRAVAVAAGECPTDLDDRLANNVDADALDELFEPTSDTTGSASSGVWFEFSGYRVVVYGSGEIEVRSSASTDQDVSRSGPPQGCRGERRYSHRQIDAR